MTLRLTLLSRKAALLTAGIAATFVCLAAMPSLSRADLWSGRLPGKSWTTDGHVYAIDDIFAEVLSGPSAICVGPVTEALTFPYGWACGSRSVNWEFTAIWAAGGVDNPNSKEDSFYSANS